jgi:hypothetical protein
MRAVKRKVTDMTVDELKGIIHEVISEDMEVWRETFEIMADSKLMGQIRKADLDRAAGKKSAFIAWDDLKKCIKSFFIETPSNSTGRLTTP